jgi:hypothetical protein
MPGRHRSRTTSKVVPTSPDAEKEREVGNDGYKLPNVRYSTRVKCESGDVRISMKGAVSGDTSNQNHAPRLCLGALLSTSV